MAQSGPLESRAVWLANRLVGNPPGTTLIESTLNGPALVALRDVVVGPAGRGAATRCRAARRPNHNPGPHRRPRHAAPDRGRRTRLSRRRRRDRGRRVSGLHMRPDRQALSQGDVLGLAREVVRGHEMQARPAEVPSRLVIRLHRGSQWSQAAKDALTSAPFTVTTGDRMGVRLEGPEVSGGELLSESPPPGAVQVRPSGARSCCSPTASAARDTTSRPSFTPTTSRLPVNCAPASGCALPSWAVTPSVGSAIWPEEYREMINRFENTCVLVTGAAGRDGAAARRQRRATRSRSTASSPSSSPPTGLLTSSLATRRSPATRRPPALPRGRSRLVGADHPH